MGIKLVIVVALICSLVSVSSAVPGTASVYTGGFPPSKNCPGVRYTGNLYAVVNKKVKDFGCGWATVVACLNKPYCKSPNYIGLRIVDYCDPAACPGDYDMMVSKEAFDQLATAGQSKIDIDVRI